jgi:polygalacturonase
MSEIPRRDFLRAGLAAAAYGACGSSWGGQFAGSLPMSSQADLGWSQVPSILAGIIPPKFPDRDFLITDYGASDKNGRNSAPGINAAVQACYRAGGGRVVFPAGRWLSNGPIRLLSHVNLFLEKDATITFGTDPKDYLPLQLVRWQGVRCYNYSPLIYALKQKDIAITGSGTLNGQGQPDWNDWTDKQHPDYLLLEEAARKGVPLEDRIFGPGYHLRPTFFDAYRCENVLVEGVTFEGSPFWTMHPTFCSNVTIRDVTVQPGAENDDGCDPDSCQNVLITGCKFSTVDDNISIKAGLNPDAIGLPTCENIVIQHCDLQHSDWSGLTIGTQIGGFVNNVFIENCTVQECINAHFIKGHANWGGGVENVYIRANEVLRCESVLNLLPDADDEAGKMGPPIFSNIQVQDLVCNRFNAVAFAFTGDPRLPIDGVNLQGIDLNSDGRLDEISNVVHLSAGYIYQNGLPVKIKTQFAA